MVEAIHAIGGTVTRAIAAVVSMMLLPAIADAGFRYDRTRNVLYIENGGTATLGSIHAAVPGMPLRRVDAERRIWLLGASIVVTNGGGLKLHGTAAGGDVNELRLKSDNDGYDRFVAITADHGFVDIRATKITSWDSAIDGPDLEHETYGRAFIRARSRLRSMVLIPLQSRMDVNDSELAYLGYGANESYGVVWKVVARQPYVLNHVRVFGNVVNSDIHHNFFGLYTSGARGSEWRKNKVHHNVQYGLAPHTRSDAMVIEDNDVHDNGHHGITVRQQCVQAVIRNNRVFKNGASGINVHRDSHEATVTGNRVHENLDSGITIYASDRAVVHDNIVLGNGHVGLQLAMGSTGARIERNEVGDNGFYGIFVGAGKGRADPPDRALPRGNVIARNIIYGSTGEDLRTGDASLNEFTDNSLLVNADAERAVHDARSIFTNPPRGEYAVLAGDPPRAQPVAAAAPVQAPRSAGGGIEYWPFPEPVLWLGAVALVLALLLRSGFDERHDQDC